MKKLVFLFAAVVAVSFASCDNTAKNNAEAVDSLAADTAVVEEVIDTVAQDTVAGDSVVAE